MVSTMDNCPILLIGRRIASAAEPKHSMTISSREATGSCQVVPHLPAIRNWNIILFNGNPSTHPVTHPKAILACPEELICFHYSTGIIYQKTFFSSVYFRPSIRLKSSSTYNILLSFMIISNTLRNCHLFTKHIPKYKNREQCACSHHYRICHHKHPEKRLLPIYTQNGLHDY